MTEKRFTVVTTEGQTQLILPMPLPYRPIPSWLWLPPTPPWFWEVLAAIVLVPLWVIGAAIVRFIKPIEPPPRALFTITPDRFQMLLVERGTGDRTTFACDPKKIVELRKNRFEKGLWIHVRGETMDTFPLRDIDDCTIQSLADALCGILNAATNRASCGLATKTRELS